MKDEVLYLPDSPRDNALMRVDDKSGGSLRLIGQFDPPLEWAQPRTSLCANP